MYLLSFCVFSSYRSFVWVSFLLSGCFYFSKCSFRRDCFMVSFDLVLSQIRPKLVTWYRMGRKYCRPYFNCVTKQCLHFVAETVFFMEIFLIWKHARETRQLAGILIINLHVLNIPVVATVKSESGHR